jgi:GT2 family glycosyltransferase
MSVNVANEFSIIITTHNSADYIVPCLKSIFSQTVNFRFEVIVFDNKSKDNTTALVRNEFKDVILFENDKDLGFAGANNAAALRSTSEVLFLLNADTKLPDGALNQLRREIANLGDGRVIITPMQLSYDAGVFLNCGLGLDIFGFPLNEGADEKYFYADGAALLVRKNDFMNLGMFDDEHYLIQEDVDLSWKARLLGYEFKRAKDLIVFHKSGHSIGTGSSSTKTFTTSVFRRYYGERNILRNLLKNYSAHNLMWILPVTVTASFFEVMLFMLLGKPRVSWAYVRAYYWNLENLGSTLKRRRWIQARRIVSDSTVMSNMYKGSAKIRLLFEIGIPSVQ